MFTASDFTYLNPHLLSGFISMEKDAVFSCLLKKLNSVHKISFWCQVTAASRGTATITKIHAGLQHSNTEDIVCFRTPC